MVSALSSEGINKANGKMQLIAFLLLVKLQQDKEEILPKQRPDKVSQLRHLVLVCAAKMSV